MKLRRNPHLTLSSVAALVVACGCTVMGVAPNAQGEGDWIDVHVHLFADKGAFADFDEAARQALHPTGDVNAEWVAVLRDFPDRFVLGSDTMIVAANYTGPQTPRLFASRGTGQRHGIRRLLSVLPPEVARRVGYANAERLYKLGQ